jgi:hypothetical protein
MDAVQQQWNYPRDMGGKSCRVRVTQISSGDVVSADIQECASRSLAESVRRAIISASPLPMPADPSLFESTVIFTFIVPSRE